MKQRLRYFLAYFFALVYQFPYKKLVVIGITGTDGKTTTSHLIYHLLKSQGKKVGLLSTIESTYFDGERENKLISFWSKIDMPLKQLIKLPLTRAFNEGQHVTTAWAPTIQHMLAQLRDMGCEYVVLESTSHAFDQKRLACIRYSVVGITNINYEHLDYHKTFENYLMAKALIFNLDSRIPKLEGNKGYAYLNADNELSKGFFDYAKTWDIKTYSLKNAGDINVNDVRYELNKTSFKYDNNSFETQLVGEYNIYNCTLALSIVTGLGINTPDLVNSLKTFSSPKGRFERFSTKSHGLVVVDFAHTPQSYEQLFTYLDSIGLKGKLISVFGCAGLRDATKRPKMGFLAGKFCDLSIITAEDPRTERLEDINNEIAKGMEKAGATYIEDLKLFDLNTNCYTFDVDRKSAIEAAISLSGPQDVVLILGKGHEESMCFGENEIPWSDQSVVKDYLKRVDSA